MLFLVVGLTAMALAAAAGVLASRRLRELRHAVARLTAEAQRLASRIQELELHRSQAQTILESMTEGVAALNPDGRVVWLNASAQRLFGISQQQAVGKRLTEFLRQPEIDGFIREVLAQRRSAALELHAFSPREATLRFQAVPCEGGAQDAAAVLVAQDVTEMRRLEAMRREFVANVSHELKAPLTSIKGLVETLLNGALDDPANNQRFVQLINGDVNRLSHLIDDLLELSQIESKASPLRLDAVSVRRLMEEVAAQLRPAFSEHQVTFSNTIPETAPAVRGDVDRLRQVFVNLLDNAAKFNKPGGRITVAATPQGEYLDVTVEDTGVGIPTTDLPRVFERFYRVDKARSRELGGTGLGLAIVKHLVELHQGRVTVRSHPGQGTVFTVSLPLGAARSAV